MRVDIKQLSQYVDRKLLSCQGHPTADLLIWNYTQRCQFEKAWDEVTTMCRGLITDLKGNIHSRPFKKFFNLDEKPEVIPTDSDPIVFEKMDGSLGITYWVDGMPYLATRGSFTSAQALKGTQMLHSFKAVGILLPEFTYLFEIIYPENRIVVDYCGQERLVLLAKINTETGLESTVTAINFAFDVPKVFNFHDLPKSLNNSEGYVFWWPDHGIRAKSKFKEYVRLHRLITGVNKKRIWEMLRNNQPLDELLERVPDEFYKWVQDTVNELKSKYNTIETAAKDGYKAVKSLPTRKDQALALRGMYNTNVVFAMLDGRDYTDMIWRKLKPKHEVPFNVVEMGDQIDNS